MRKRSGKEEEKNQLKRKISVEKTKE